MRAAGLLLGAPLLWAAYAEYQAAKHKVDQIESNSLKTGSRVTFTLRELNAYAQQEAREVAPEGVRDVRLELGNGRASGTANVDFLKVKNAQGQPTGWLLSRLLSGQRPVAVTARVQSLHGRARVDVERVEISGVAIQGTALDFLVQQYVIPYYPEAKVSQWFELAHHVDHFDVRPAGVDVWIGR